MQLSMFNQGEDTPLFSQTCQRAELDPFKPQAQPKQTKMHNCPACLDTGTIQVKGQQGKICFCPAGRARDRLIRDCASISSGTLGGLIGCQEYSIIDSVQGMLVEWVSGQTNIPETWQEAWDGFKISVRMLMYNSPRVGEGLSGWNVPPLNDTLKHGLEAYGFIIPCGSAVTADQFADLIERHYSGPRAETIAHEFRTFGR